MGLLRNDGLTDHFLSLNSVIKRSYNEVKKQFNDGINHLKDEFTDLREQAGTCLDHMASPVNNFLKDLGQIERDFLRELDSNAFSFRARNTGGNIIPLDQALQGCMEENY